MEEIYIKSVKKILSNLKELETKLRVKISIKEGKTVISGNEVDEYFAERVLMALDFPFDIDEALLLRSEDYMFNVLNIKDYTKRHDFAVIKARIIGTKGKTLKVLQDLTNSIIVVKENNVAIISSIGDFERIMQAVVSLIRGSKHGNVYSFLEKAHKRERS